MYYFYFSTIRVPWTTHFHYNFITFCLVSKGLFHEHYLPQSAAIADMLVHLLAAALFKQNLSFTEWEAKSLFLSKSPGLPDPLSCQAESHLFWSLLLSDPLLHLWPLSIPTSSPSPVQHPLHSSASGAPGLVITALEQAHAGRIHTMCTSARSPMYAGRTCTPQDSLL